MIKFFPHFYEGCQAYPDLKNKTILTFKPMPRDIFERIEKMSGFGQASRINGYLRLLKTSDNPWVILTLAHHLHELTQSRLSIKDFFTKLLHQKRTLLIKSGSADESEKEAQTVSEQ